MKVTAFNGSPKGAAGNTNVMVTAFLAGAANAGAEVENIFLNDKAINHCKACGGCMVSNQCVIKDDMGDLIPKYVESDIVVFATPLYIDNISGMLKVFLDRTLCIGNPLYEKDENGEYRGAKSKLFKNGIPPKIVVISNGGYPQRSNFQVISLLMKRVARNFHMEVIGEIYAAAGPVLTSPIKELEPIINGYKKLLEKAGQEIVREFKISGETHKLLEQNLVPEDLYVQKTNEYFQMVLTQATNQS